MLAVTAPLFLLMALGFIAVRLKVYPSDMLPAIGRAILYFCIPAVILNNMLQSGAGALFDGPYVLAYALASLLTLMLVIGLQSWFHQEKKPEAPVYSLGASVSNSMFVGYPVVAQVLPDIAGQVLVLCVLVENLIVTPIALALAESREAKLNPECGGSILRDTLNRLVKNPLILSVVLGAVVSAVGVPVPEFVIGSLDMLASGAAGIALVYIGGSLVGHSLRGNIGNISLVCIGKLVVHPILVGLLFSILPGNDSELTLGAIMMAAAPMMTIFPVLGARFGFGQTCASALAVTTALAFFSLNTWLWILF